MSGDREAKNIYFHLTKATKLKSNHIFIIFMQKKGSFTIFFLDNKGTLTPLSHPVYSVKSLSAGYKEISERHQSNHYNEPFVSTDRNASTGIFYSDFVKFFSTCSYTESSDDIHVFHGTLDLDKCIDEIEIIE